MEDETVPYAAKLAEVDGMFIMPSPEVDGPGKAVSICMSLETASDSAPRSKDVIPSEAGCKVA